MTKAQLASEAQKKRAASMRRSLFTRPMNFRPRVVSFVRFLPSFPVLLFRANPGPFVGFQHIAATPPGEGERAGNSIFLDSISR